MKFSFYKSYRFKIIVSFLSIISVTILLFIAYSYFNKKTKDLQKVITNIYDLESNFSNNEKNFQSFLLYGYKTPKFYKTKEEDNIDTFINNISLHKESLDSIFKELQLNKFSLHPKTINDLRHEFYLLDSLSKRIKIERYKLGYRNFGRIGTMRKVAHSIEDLNLVPKEKILQLRRNEKDFLLRSDSIYINKFNTLISQLTAKNNHIEQTKNALNKYKVLFNDIAQIQLKIGNDISINDSGLYGQILKTNQSIREKINHIEAITQKGIENKNSNIAWFVKVSFTGILILMTLLIFYLSQILTSDLKRLQASIHKFIKSGFKEYDAINSNEESKILEVNFLYKAYDMLKKNLLDNIDGLKLTIEELERTTAYKSSFLANMSHEIRTPLNGIIGILNLLNQTKLNDEQIKLLEIANYSSSHLLGLINLILDYSKISAGKLELEQTKINLNQDLNQLINIFKYQASEKNIELIYNFKKSPQASRFIIGDSIRINQIIINLLNNAIKFTKKGWVKLDIKQDKLDDTYDIFHFSVEDTGIGMNEEESKKIFQAFEQVDLSTTRKFGGTGLGLAISNELANLMGSELKFTTSINKGSRFYFSLKLKKEHNDTSKLTSNSLINNLPKLGHTTRVLVVDDNAMNQKVLGLMLNKFNLTIDYANNGIEAVEQFSQKHYDMVFMDIQMPIMDGLEATKSIKATEKFKSNPVPIVAVSASAYTDDRKQANIAGIDDFISKPIEIKNLHNLLIKYSLQLQN
ncbi:ATP-binding protein [Flavivirga eckloniae]|uniref:histidine kinase n=1 Tax=Flavivirga eckloniae TaxID=1803846 RepID=A0A2K9PRZ0_9FLAO|nr:ATP-binding protein [Flavivirga eckloniae]AUP79831.1 hypothetical protein C1H87_14405 [Flavivirga eckloniae]